MTGRRLPWIALLDGGFVGAALTSTMAMRLIGDRAGFAMVQNDTTGEAFRRVRKHRRGNFRDRWIRLGRPHDLAQTVRKGGA